MKSYAALAAMLVSSAAVPAFAQTPQTMVSANDPASVVSALEMGGYEATLDEDGSGDPMITTELGGMVSYIYFYGCVENAECSSLMFVTGFDRAEPWTADEALKISQNIRFASTWLDEEGDPFISWDVVADQAGIPIGNFSLAVRSYANTVDQVADIVFAEENAE
ncbi:MAG: YbjN domain-containing protein [Erythrobacter sp.]|nr:YbjN domain-containing protein [Erythrobacter sp.]NCQ64357.1 YbjN domain-containing protein [Alphaproteobacteria bacterium]